MVSGSFMVSAVAKLAYPRAVIHMITKLGLPSSLVMPSALGLIAAESLVAVLATWPAGHRLAGALTVTLSLLFGASAMFATLSHRVVECACFGATGDSLGPKHMARALVLLAAGTALFWIRPPWDDNETPMVLAGVAVLLCNMHAVRVVIAVREAGRDRRALAESTARSVIAELD